MDWKFQDPPNVAVITHKKVITSGIWIAYVSHDENDGGWQFLIGESMTDQDAIVVSLRNIIELDASVMELADLPIGWQAWREDKNAPWKRSKVE